MRILVLHTQYQSGMSSGENRSVLDEVRLLTEAGHSVRSWLPQVESRGRHLRAAREVVWSRRATAEIECAIAKGTEVVHAHNLFPCVSPTALRSSLPTVMTVRNWRLDCLAGTLLRDDGLCELCVGKTPWRGVMHACYRGSRPQSLALAGSLVVHRRIGSFERIDRVIAMNDFHRERLIAGGFASDRVVVRRGFAWPRPRRRGSGKHYLAIGRLSKEKGYDSIVRTWSSRFPLLVIGDGPERTSLARQSARGVKYVGSVSPSKLDELLRAARAVLVPSRCYETGPRVVMEGFAAGVPAVVSNLGGIPENVEHGKSGLVVGVGDTETWQDAVAQLDHNSEATQMGAHAFTAWRERFTPAIGALSLEQIYRDAIEHRRRVA